MPNEIGSENASKTAYYWTKPAKDDYLPKRAESFVERVVIRPVFLPIRLLTYSFTGIGRAVTRTGSHVNKEMKGTNQDIGRRILDTLLFRVSDNKSNSNTY